MILIDQAALNPIRIQKRRNNIDERIYSTQKIGEFEQALLQKLKAKDTKILDSIRKDKTMSDETEKSLKDMLEQLLKSFA